MDRQTTKNGWALTEKEKQTLRLMVRGHDAKSIARSLNLSVHTINERLRDARRKMAVSSSREAARLLLEAEGGGTPLPEILGYMALGDDERPHREDPCAAPTVGAGGAARQPSIILGVCLMSLIFGLLAITAMSDAPSAPAATTEAAVNSEVVTAARQWLSLVDQGKWQESYESTATSFQQLNTAQVWASVSEKVRTPLGAMLSRTFVSQENLPAPPHGYEVVKFRTSYANKADALETVSLDRENGAWRVVGVTIE